MITIEEATASLKERANAHWLEWVIGRGNWPLRVPLRAPTAVQVGSDLLTVQTWAGGWRAALTDARIPGTVDWVSRRVSGMTTFSWPNRLTIESAEEALTPFPELKATFERTAGRLDQAAAHPHVVWSSREQAGLMAARAIAAVDDDDWAAALNVTEYLATHPVTNMMLRQLPIPGINTKWLEGQGHAALILLLMFPDQPREGRDPIAQLTHLIGLRTTSPRINITLACPELRASAGGLTQFAAASAVLDASTITQPATVLVIENAEPGHTITGEYEGLAIIHGLGKAVSLIGSLRWLHDADEVLYWGDIDRAGLTCLSLLRHAGVSARSILMDNETLDEHLELCRTAPTQQPNYTTPEHLSTSEVQVYERLSTYHRTHGVELQLEQERISLSKIVSVVKASLAVSA